MKKRIKNRNKKKILDQLEQETHSNRKTPRYTTIWICSNEHKGEMFQIVEVEMGEAGQECENTNKTKSINLHEIIVFIHSVSSLSKILRQLKGLNTRCLVLKLKENA